MGTLKTSTLESRMIHYKPEDGEYIEVVVLNKTFPFLPKNFWESCIFGCGVGGFTTKVKRLPLSGRLLFMGGRPRAVILAKSLRAWFLHYNPGREQTADLILAGLLRRTKRYHQYLKALKLERLASAGVYRPGIEKKPRKPKEKATTKTKLDWSVGSVW